MEQKVIRLSEFKPRSYQLPILDALENKGYKRILAIMPRRCLSGSTHIIMRNGSYKLLKDIKPGDEVLSWDGNSFVPDKVTDIWSTGLKKARDVRSYDYPGVISAYEHSFATAQPGKNSIEFCTVNDFTRDTILLHYAGIQGDPGRSRACKPLEAEFLGYLLSSIADLSENRILFKSSRRDILERIAECSEQIFGVPPAWREYSGVFSVFFSLTNHKYINVVDFIQKIDLAYIIKNRKLSTFVWELDEESLIHLFRGLLIIDGRIDLYKAMFQPTSLDLDARDYGRIEILISICHFAGFEYEIYWLFRKIGIVPSVPFVGDKNLKQMGIRNTGDCMRILRSGVWWCNEANQRCAIERIKHMPPSQRTYNKGCYFGDCYSYPAHSECLYDIEVEKNGNFVANGYLVHNSGKDITAFNLCIRQCLRKPCVVFYVFPTYSQAKKVIWDSVTNDGRRILDFIPRDVVHSLNSQEMKVRFVNQSLLQLVGSDNFDCFDDQTEILTEDGWKLFKDLNKTERVGTLKDGYLVYERPSAYQCYDYAGEMFYVCNNSMDFMVTPNHRFFVRSVKDVYKFKEVGSPTIKNDMIPATSNWSGVINHTFVSVKHGISMPMVNFIPLLGLFLSDGEISKDNNSIIIVNLKPVLRNKVKALLNRLELHYEELRSNLYIHHAPLARYFSSFGGYEDRFIPKDIKALDKSYLQILFAWLSMGDSYADQNPVFCSHSKRLADDVQEVLIKIGMSGNVIGRKARVNTRKKLWPYFYEVIGRPGRFKMLSRGNGISHIHTKRYEGKIYCVSVSSGVIKVRRNGKEMWSGNSLMGTNPQGVVFSEYALQDERCYQYIRPILTANDGWALFLSCVVGNTLVLTPDGLRPIDSLCSSRTDYTDYNKPIYGINGFNNASDFYYGGIQPTLKIKTHLGFSLECTPVHKLWTGSEWKQAADCRRGDLLPIQYGQMVFADSEPVAWLSLPIRCPSGHIEHPVYSMAFYGARMLLSREHSSISYKDIHSPYTDSIEQFLEFQRLVCVSTKETQIQFLRGIFDALSYTASRKELRGNILLIITNQEFRAVLQSMLLNFGIVSACVHEDGLVIKKMSLHKFYRDIGFAHKNKQWHWKYVPSHVRDEDPITPNLYYDPIVSIEDSSAEVFDFVIPETHSFFSNGFVSHNTPRGKNHLYDLYQIAKQSPLWFCYKLTVDDTCHISAEDIQRERDEGIMSEDLIQQEYYTSWTMGVEGAYYAKYIDKLRLSGHIGNVPWDPSFKVNTSWDLGVRDSTTIIFFQIVGGSYHIIDCYDNAKEGLEHYVKVVSEKPYVYGKHIAPHDIRVREFTSGVARIDKARQLGIKFTVASDVSVMDGIEMVRTTLPRCYFDQSHCASLVKALENYRQEFDVKRKVYKDHPLHDQFSHYADAFRYLCVSLPKTRDGASPDDLDKRYREALYGSEQNLPSVFRDL